MLGFYTMENAGRTIRQLLAEREGMMGDHGIILTPSVK